MRNAKRLPKLYKLLKDNIDIFGEFIEVEILDDAIVAFYKRFLDNYEDLLISNYENPDVRIGQHLINNNIIPDSQCWYTEDTQWFIKAGYIKPEDIMLWGVRGLDAKEKYQEWMNTKPKLNDSLDFVEKTIYHYDKLKNYEVYARRYYTFLQREPKVEYRFLNELDSNHISAILETQSQISPTLRQTFQKILDERQKSL